jgi:hypothetical protein
MSASGPRLCVLFGTQRLMCHKCAEIDKKTQHYRSLASRTTDQMMLTGIAELIEQMNKQKLELHPKEK